MTPSGSPGSTIYGTFGTKSELFASVLRRYGPARAPGLRELRDAPSPCAALVRAFELLRVSGGPRCLVLDTIVKTPAISPAVAGLVEATGEDLLERFGAVIERGRAAGEIDDDDDPIQAAGALGRYVLVHTGAARESVLVAVVRQAQALLPPPS